MKRLVIDGTTRNGDGVILSDDKGAKFLVENDPRLAAAVHTSRQLEMALQTFSPREIQARVRAGASADVVAAETGWPVDKVLRYAEPLLAERAFIAQQAQAVEVRRSGGGTTLRATADAAVGADPDSDAIAWDAWRREDGKWVVAASFADADGAHVAEWTYDHAGHNIHPLDDDARTLMGVRREDADDDISALTDALDLITDRAADADTAAAPGRPHLVAVPDAHEEAAAKPIADEAPVVAPAYSEPTVSIPTPDAEKPAEGGAGAAPAKKPAARKPKSRRGRASVPSWDEILFGATPHDD